MDLQQLLSFIALEDRRLKSRFESYPDNQRRILARMVKLSEEVGELADAVLGYNDMQRQDKLDQKKTDDVSQELADVIITTLLLAHSLNVDISEALTQKMEKINTRYE